MALKDELVATTEAALAAASALETSRDDAETKETQAELIARVWADFQVRARREAALGASGCEVVTVKTQLAASRVVTYLQGQGFAAKAIPTGTRFTVWASWR